MACCTAFGPHISSLQLFSTYSAWQPPSVVQYKCPIQTPTEAWSPKPPGAGNAPNSGATLALIPQPASSRERRARGKTLQRQHRKAASTSPTAKPKDWEASLTHASELGDAEHDARSPEARRHHPRDSAGGGDEPPAHGTESALNVLH